MPQIEVTFDVDANGILKVSAKDKATGRSQHITITASSGLSDAEVEKMRQDAEAHAEEDRKRKDLIEVRNNADNTIYAAEKAIRDFGDKVEAGIRSEVESKIAEVKSASQSDDVEKIRVAVDALGQAIQKIGASVYQQGGAADSGEPDVVDGEVKE
jgi:molecular chaperone DnaK